jgi:hypothetical protein
MRSEAAAYWLGQSEGFRVDSARGRVGLVEQVVRGAHPELPEALVVRMGLLGRRIELVPVEAVEQVEPRKLRILLRPSWRPSEHDFLTDLVARLRAAALRALPREAEPAPRVTSRRSRR